VNHGKHHLFCVQIELICHIFNCQHLLVPFASLYFLKDGELCWANYSLSLVFTCVLVFVHLQPQHEHMERHKKRFGERMDKSERDRKREARRAHRLSEFAQKSFGWRAKMFNQRRFKEKAALRKTIAMHEEGSNKHSNDDKVTDGMLQLFC
jgi:hypothetical protein